MSWSIFSRFVGQRSSLGGPYNRGSSSESIQFLGFGGDELALEAIGETIILLTLVLHLDSLRSQLLLGFLHGLTQSGVFGRHTFCYIVAELKVLEPGCRILRDMTLKVIEVTRYDRGLRPVGHRTVATPKGRSYVMSRADVRT
jgi:hypothetical protein